MTGSPDPSALIRQGQIERFGLPPDATDEMIKEAVRAAVDAALNRGGISHSQLGGAALVTSLRGRPEVPARVGKPITRDGERPVSIADESDADPRKYPKGSESTILLTLKQRSLEIRERVLEEYPDDSDALRELTRLTNSGEYPMVIPGHTYRGSGASATLILPIENAQLTPEIFRIKKVETAHVV